MSKRATISAPDRYFDRLAQYSSNASEAFRTIIDEHELMSEHLSAQYLQKHQNDVAGFRSPLEVSANALPNVSNRSALRAAIVGAVKMMVSRRGQRNERRRK